MSIFTVLQDKEKELGRKLTEEEKLLTTSSYMSIENQEDEIAFNKTCKSNIKLVTTLIPEGLSPVEYIAYGMDWFKNALQEKTKENINILFLEEKTVDNKILYYVFECQNKNFIVPVNCIMDFLFNNGCFIRGKVGSGIGLKADLTYRTYGSKAFQFKLEKFTDYTQYINMLRNEYNISV